MDLSVLSCLHPADVYEKFSPGSDLVSRWKLCCFSDLDLVEGPDLSRALAFLFALSLERFHYPPLYKAGLCTGGTRCSTTHFVVKIFINATLFKGIPAWQWTTEQIQSRWPLRHDPVFTVNPLTPHYAVWTGGGTNHIKFLILHQQFWL